MKLKKAKHSSMLIWVILIAMIASKSFAQESKYDQVRNLYENFEYDKVIQLSSDLLNEPQLQDSLKINLHMMRAVSFFAKGNNEQMRNSFQGILYLKKDFSPNTRILNPTLVRMFNVMKLDYLQKLADEEAKKDSAATVSQIVYKKQISFGSAFLKNMVLPGWGQLSYGKDRGLIYSLAYTVNLGALIYFAIDASRKQDAYQRETEEANFDQRYSDYNKSYKMRNNLWISWAVILLYSQIDLLLFHGEERIDLESNKISVAPSLRMPGEYGVAIRIPF